METSTKRATTQLAIALLTACLLLVLFATAVVPTVDAKMAQAANGTTDHQPGFVAQFPTNPDAPTPDAPTPDGPTPDSSETFVAAHLQPASVQHTIYGHRLWLDIRFDLDEYRDVTVDYGDGTAQSLVDYLTAESANVVLGQAPPPPPPTRWRTDHSYELALTPVERDVLIIWQGQPGVNDRVESITVRPQAVFALEASPLRIRAISDCDWHSAGDFTVTWDRGAGKTTPPEFQLWGGASKVFDEFAFTRDDITLAHGWRDIARIEVQEHDPGGSGFLGTITDPTRWRTEFKGVRPTGNSPAVIQQLGDHSVEFDRTRELGHECFVNISFSVDFILFQG